MSYAQKIVSAALAGAAGLFTVERAQGFCLKFSRQCIEKALGKPSHWLYSLMPGDTPRTALGAEQALRKKGWAVPVTEMRPGDLVFNGKVSLPDGHVGLCVADGLILENTTAQRGVRFGGAIALTTVKQFGPVTTVIRLPEGC